MLKTQSHIAVVGGGFSGMVSALRLLKAGYQVTVLESSNLLGGLTTNYDYGSFRWDKFYHCILSSDIALLGLLDELDLTDQIHWTCTQTGFFSHGKMYPMTTPRDLFKFPHISFFSKLRLGLATLYVSGIEDGRALEKIPLSDWTTRLFGRTVYREMWEPLFRCKLGEMRNEASAAFLWGTIRRLYSTREKGPSKQEKLGYVTGGYKMVFDRLRECVKQLGGAVHSGVVITAVENDTPRADKTHVKITHASGSMLFDGAIITLPNKAIASILRPTKTTYVEQLAKVTYLGLICVVLVLRRKLSPYYVTNITEKSPFTGIIEMTNLIDSNVETNGLHLVYLPRYTGSKDPLFLQSDEEVWAYFQPQLLRMHADLCDDDIVSRFVFRERTVQPVPTLNYSAIVPPIETPLNRVFIVNTAQIINSTLNNNVMASLTELTCLHLMKVVPRYIESDTETICCKETDPSEALRFEGVSC